MRLSKSISVTCFGALLTLLLFIWARNNNDGASASLAIETAAGPGPVSQDDQKRNDKEAIEKFVKSFTEPIRIQESKPITVNDAQFVLVAQTNWKPGKPGNPSEPMIVPMVAPIEIQLRIANLAKGDLVFPTFQCVGVRILSADGKEVKPRVARKGDLLTRSVLVPGGASYSVCPRGELRWDEKTKASELSFNDGTGSQLVIGPLQPGRYKMALWYSVSPEDAKKRKAGDRATWVGKAVTEDVVIDILDGTTRGYPPATEQYAGPSSGPIIVRESKPVTVNEARFVVVAQTDWKSGQDKAVALDLQLRITNLSKKDLIFPTFDTFGVGIVDSKGNKVMLRGGRDATRITRPILVRAGASYSLSAEGGPPSIASRRAELSWDAQAKTSEFVYFDGTGSVLGFGPLRPGRYKLTFRYRVSGNGPIRTERDPATWLGNAVSDDVLIDLSAP